MPAIIQFRFFCLSVSYLKTLIKIIILPNVFKVHETSCLSLREEHRLRVYENRVLKKISEPTKEEVVEG
jgi:hypothetical protein